MWQLYFFIPALAFRLWTLAVSKRHERSLKERGAKEYGQANSVLLALTHTAFYASALAESYWRNARFGSTTVVGIGLYSLGALMLLAVMHSLGEVWTLKLLIANQHRLVRNWLYRAVRHPNYFLAIIPELTGLALALQAPITFCVIGAFYIYPLARRVKEENAVMGELFPSY